MVQDDFGAAQVAQAGSHLALLAEFASFRQQAGHVRQTAVPLGDLLDELRAILRRVCCDSHRRLLLSLRIHAENRQHDAGQRPLHGRSAAGAAAISGTGDVAAVRGIWPVCRVTTARRPGAASSSKSAPSCSMATA